MAKKRTAGDGPAQQRIPGTYDPVPEPVQQAADSYVEAKRELAAWREAMNGRRDDLIEVMKANDVQEIDIDDGEKRLVLIDAATVKIQRKKAAEPEVEDEVEDATA
jgi:hypothetical protein